MFKKHVKPSRELRNNYAEIARLVKEHDQVIITNKGEGEAVLISFEDYAEYERYLYRKYAEQKIAEAEEAAASPGAWLSEDEFWSGLR